MLAEYWNTGFIQEASLAVRMNTGWKPMLLYAVARRDGPWRWFRHDRDSLLDAQESNVA